MTRRTALSWMAAPLVAARRIEVRGMYSNPKPFWDLGARLDDYGVNALFVHGGSITDAMVARAGSEGARVFAEFPTLNGRGYVDKHPEAWPIDLQGRQSPPATWFMGACPTEPGFFAWRMKQLEELLDRFDLAGVWLDYFHWHAQFEDPNPVLPETCFCPSCLQVFREFSGLSIPDGPVAQRAAWILSRHNREWRNWRVTALNRWAIEARRRMNAKRPSALLGVYHCPWTDDEFNGARHRVLGLDFAPLAPLVDVFSPMVYHGRMHRRPEWVGEYVEWLSRQPRPKKGIWPIVQAHEAPADEFEQVLQLATAGVTSGVMMFTAQSVAADPSKLAAMRRLFRKWT